MAKDGRFRYTYRKNASKLHKIVGEILRNDKFFSTYQAYQEYPVNRVNPKYFSGSHKFDWVIPSLRLVIECHGKQHYEVATFGSDVVDAIEAFHDGQARDYSKKMAALAAGYRYIVVSYKEQNKVTVELILAKIKEADTELSIYNLEHADDTNEIPTTQELAREQQKMIVRDQRRKYLKSNAHKEKLKIAKKIRRQRYRRLKELKDGSR